MHSSDPFSKLDNPAWWALTGVQQQFAIGPQHVKRYQHGILPFAALETATTDNLVAVCNLFEPGEIFYLIGELPPLPAGMQLLKELPCVQMVYDRPFPVLGGTPASVSSLTPDNKDALFNFINKVQPGYYEPNTHQLGNYYGVWENGQLVATAGVRMALDHLTEISAICTDPAYTGRKFAQYLIHILCNGIVEQGDTPFLHVLQTNERALRLYEYLGFTTRRTISFWQIQSS
jgi:ribosomal protein S18 acetylase RimI-like enzyme